jgi:hypothetical protein
MPSRSELVLRACAANVDHTSAAYANDSNLEQAVLYAEKHLTATSSATTLAPTATAIARESGDANV